MPVAGLWRSARRVNALSAPGLWRVCAGFKNHFEAVLSHDTLNTTIRPSLLNAPLHPGHLVGTCGQVVGTFVALVFYEKLSCVYIYFIVQNKIWALGQEKVGKSPRRAWQIRKIKLSLMRRLST